MTGATDVGHDITSDAAADRPTIVAEGVSKSFGPSRVLQGLDLDVRSGEVLVVQGASGAGKTTLLRILAGLELPDDGRVLLDGRLASDRGWALPPRERSVGVAFQRSALWPHMTVAQNIAFGLEGLPRETARERIDGLLAQLELEGLAGRYPDQLSGGQSRRVGLARALAAAPRHLLLDEPLSNIEPDLRERLMEVVRQHAERRDSCVVYVTHDHMEAEAIGGDIAVLRDGRLVMRGAD